jgi:hypothetical protein
MVGVSSLDVVSRRVAYIVCLPQGGAMGTTWYQLWRTADGGRTWSLAASDSSSASANTLTRSHMPSLPSGFGPTGIAFGTTSRGLICQLFTPRHGDACQLTSDGGHHWSGVRLPTPKPVRRLPAYDQVVQWASAPIIVSSGVAYVAVAFTPAESTPLGKAAGLALYRTSDGGRLWRLMHWFGRRLLRPGALQSFGPSALHLAFATPSAGSAFLFLGAGGNPPVRALTTRDGGATWHAIGWPRDWQPTAPPSFSPGGGLGLVLIESGKNTYLAATADAGGAWHLLTVQTR